jgi:hypothetical protein
MDILAFGQDRESYKKHEVFWIGQDGKFLGCS